MKKHLQVEFTKFHEAIKLLDTDENEILRAKRGLLIDDLTAGLKKKFEDDGLPVPKFDWFNQGSYAMGTGVKPLDSDYDIDIGIRFHFSKSDNLPVDVKEWVYDVLNATAKRTVQWKLPCVRVQYHKESEPIYHVDLAIYSGGEYNEDLKDYLARGKPSSKKEDKIWETADPETLKDIVENRFTEADDKAQFRRVIRYLKRWKDENFSSIGSAAPTGIAITALALSQFEPMRTIDTTENKSYYDDLGATTRFVEGILGQFTLTWDGEKYVPAIAVHLPVEPFNDLFCKMTLVQKGALKTKLETLRDTLNAVITNGGDPHADATKLQGEFGSDFPVPDKKETAQKTSKPYTSSSQSA